MNGTILALIGASIVIWSLVSISTSSMDQGKKVAWFAVVILIPFIGPLIYWLKVKKNS